MQIIVGLFALGQLTATAVGGGESCSVYKNLFLCGLLVLLCIFEYHRHMRLLEKEKRKHVTIMEEIEQLKSDSLADFFEVL